MINEINEVNRILNKKRINKKYTYRSYFLLAKYFKEEGCDSIETREKIFEWANKNGIRVEEYLNDIIKKAFKDKKKLTKDIKVYINQSDIDLINTRFDKYNTRLLAFAFICYAKINKNSDNEFTINMIDFSEWVGIHTTHIYKRYLPELEFMQLIERTDDINYLHKFKKSKLSFFKLRSRTINKGDVIFYDEDIRAEFEKIIEDAKYVSDNKKR